ncbi:hypothetical protein D3C86_2170030 [compost metagenome]
METEVDDGMVRHLERSLRVHYFDNVVYGILESDLLCYLGVIHPIPILATFRDEVVQSART